VRKNLSIVGYPVGWRDVAMAVRAIGDPAIEGRFMARVGDLVQGQSVFTAHSGNACFCVILKTLKELYSGRTEVVLPAYTAPSLIVAIRKVGLKPVLCDISRDDFNADPDGVLGVICGKTLCVLAVHMFGIPWCNIIKVKRELPSGVVMVEDGAQALGARINGIPVGLFGDVAFWSFNRGKNLPTLSGGMVTTFNPALAVHLRQEAVAILRPRGLLKSAVDHLKCAALCLAFDPAWYGLLRPVIERFKETCVPSDISLETYSRFRAGFGLSLLDSWEKSLDARFRNGRYLQDALSALKRVSVPKEEAGVMPVFNRMPVVFEQSRHLDQVVCLLEDAGIESSRMYVRPLHHIFDLGYQEDDFPNAVFLAKNLLTLPVHPLVRQEDLDRMVSVIRKVVME
jgi:perosamine synthetase